MPTMNFEVLYKLYSVIWCRGCDIYSEELTTWKHVKYSFIGGCYKSSGSRKQVVTECWIWRIQKDLSYRNLEENQIQIKIIILVFFFKSFQRSKPPGYKKQSIQLIVVKAFWKNMSLLFRSKRIRGSSGRTVTITVQIWVHSFKNTTGLVTATEWIEKL